MHNVSQIGKHFPNKTKGFHQNRFLAITVRRITVCCQAIMYTVCNGMNIGLKPH